MIIPAQWLRSQHGTWRGWVRHVLAIAEWRLGRLRQFETADVVGARRLVPVCLGNINRSAYAAAVARSLGEPTVSIGLSTTTGAPATAEAMLEATRRGIDLSGHTATNYLDYARAEGDVLLVMEIRHARRLVQLGVPPASIAFLGLWSGQRRVHLHDPHTLSGEYFSTCFGLIDDAVRRIVALRRGARQ